MNRIDGAALDRWITGNWGEDQYRDDVPEDAYCSACVDGDQIDSCTVCGGTGVDPIKVAEYQANAKAEADAEYAAYQDALANDSDPDPDDERLL